MIVRLFLLILTALSLHGCDAVESDAGGSLENQFSDTVVLPAPGGAMQQTAAILYDVNAVVLALNVGGGDHVGVDGVHYRAGDKAIGGEPGLIDQVLGAQDESVYRSYRMGELTIRHPIANGSYDITFLFAEPEDIAIGERVFDVQAQGKTVVEALDVRQARDNKHSSALARTVAGIVVSDGQLNLEFSSRVGTPVLSGIIVRSRTRDPQGWELVWGDEFDYEGSPDPDKWSIERWEAGKVNDEDQAYTARAKNVRVGGGKLTLEAHRENYGAAKYTSARMHSQGKGDFLYGRVEVRAKLPAGQGTWSALWMFPSDPMRYATQCSSGEDWHGGANCDAWPNSGEIDIAEHVGYDMHHIHGTVHNRAFYWKNHQQRKGSIVAMNTDQAFHIYSLQWTPENIYIYFDGTPYFAYFNDGTGWEAWPYDHPYHMILNLAIGGGWGSAGGPIDDSIFPVAVEVDYVRVYKARPQTEPLAIQ